MHEGQSPLKRYKQVISPSICVAIDNLEIIKRLVNRPEPLHKSATPPIIQLQPIPTIPRPLAEPNPPAPQHPQPNLIVFHPNPNKIGKLLAILQYNETD